MRPLVLISGLATGGSERVTVSFLCRLVRQGTNVTACTVTARRDGLFAKELSDAGVIRYNLGARRLADPLALLRLLQLLRRERIDMIHAHGPEAAIFGAAARCLSRVPLVVTRHVLNEPSANWRENVFYAGLALAAARRADAVVAVSSAVADRLAETAQLRRDTVRVIVNGIDLERFDRAELSARRAELRAALGFGLDDSLVLVPAVLREGKGHEVLIEALPALRARVPSARVVFAGGGEREAPLRSQARPHGDAIVFLGVRKDIPKLLAACDLVALPSLAEALPTVLIEAAAAGRPVVATRVGGTAEVVEDGRTGLLVPPSDPGALADAVATLLIDCERAHAFGEAARRLARKRFSLDLQVKHTLALWTEVVARGCR